MSDPVIGYYIIQAAVTVYSYTESQKAKRKAAAAADAAKGFQFVTEGEARTVPVVYGRAKIGGTRAYHNVKSTFAYAGNGSSTFTNLTATIPAWTETLLTWDGNSGAYSYENVAHPAQDLLSSSQGGSRNEFLFVQQAISMGTISAVYTADVDGKPFNHEDLMYGQRIEVERAGGVANPLFAANFAERANAKFTNCAYASMVFKLNRDDPQYNGGIPEVLFYIDGVSIRRVTRSGTPGAYSYSLPSTKYNDNNPAYVLLDYLTNSTYGRGLSTSQLDLSSFYDAAQICNRVVRTGAPVQGRYWGARGITTRDVPLYECNLTLDTSASIRDNVEQILSTMGDAVLVWANGKYKLQLQYPTTEAEIVVADWLTEDHIDTSTITTTYPSASDRKNYCTVSFSNDSQDFASDSVSWPTRFSTVHTALLAEDNQVPLEMEVEGSGITDRWHALAKAEELVRGSRASVVYDFSFTQRPVILEPGDIVHVNAPSADILNEYLRILEITVQEGGICKAKMVKFDYNVLAWNANDDAVVPARNNYSSGMDAPTGVSWNSASNLYGYSSGTVTWSAPTGSDVVEYVVYATSSNISAATNAVSWVEVGRSTTTQLDLVGLQTGDYVFGVVAVGSNGRRSTAATSVVIPLTRPDPTSEPDYTQPPAPTSMAVLPLVGGAVVSWDAPTYTVGHGNRRTKIWRAQYLGVARTIANAVVVAETDSTSYADYPSNAVGNQYVYWTTHVSVDGVQGLAAGGLNGMLVSPRQLVSNEIIDGAISATKLAAGLEAVVVHSGAALPTTFLGNTLFWTVTDKLYRWNGTAYVTSVDGADVIGASIDATKLSTSIAAPVRWTGASLPTTSQGNLLFWTSNNKLYRWNGTAYVSDVPVSDLSGTISQSQTDLVIGGGNLLPNSGFELDTDSDGLADSWLNSKNSTTAISLSRSASAQPFGHQWAQGVFGDTVADQGYVQVYTPGIRVPSTGKYSLSADMWSDSGVTSEFRVFLQYATEAAPSTFLTVSSTFVAATAAKQRVVTTGTLPATAAFARVILRIANTSGATQPSLAMYCDNAQLESGSASGYAPSSGELVAGAVQSVMIAAGAIKANQLSINKHLIY